MTTAEQLQDLARSVLHYHDLINEVARQRVVSGGGPGASAWSVGGPLGDQLDVAYFQVMAKARTALRQFE